MTLLDLKLILEEVKTLEAVGMEWMYFIREKGIDFRGQGWNAMA
jgi:hypothetical protein